MLNFLRNREIEDAGKYRFTPTGLAKAFEQLGLSCRACCCPGCCCWVKTQVALPRGHVVREVPGGHRLSRQEACEQAV